MKYYSFASSSRGNEDPEETFEIEVSGDDCDVRGCVREDCSHIVLMWSGNQYSKDHTWIACDDEYMINLEDAR